MVSLYIAIALRLGLPEAYAVLDRLLANAPTHAVIPLDNALTRAPTDDSARALKYATRLTDILPETRASGAVVQALLRAGKLDEARRALGFGKRLGLPSMGDALSYEGPLIDLDLAELQTAEAQELARPLLADPRPYARNQAAHAIVTALFLDGRAADAFAALTTGAKLGIDTGYTLGTARLLVRALSAGRWLGRPGLVDPAHLDWLSRAAVPQDQLLRAVRAEALVELALARSGPNAAAERTALLADLEREARRSADDPLLRDDLLLQTIPLVRAVRGDEQAAAVYRAAVRARPPARLRRCIDAALAFEAIGDPISAARAYAVASDPASAREAGIERLIAAVRSTTPPRPAPRAGDLDLRRLETTADPLLLDAIRKMR
ncbi:MAG: hypothetical protein R3F14_11100 [Polyangiaceae bacterium]